MSNFHQLEVVARGSETQFQVGEKLNDLNQHLRVIIIMKKTYLHIVSLVW